MRTLKFRVFDGFDYISKPFTLADIQDKKVQFTKDTIVMQFTGLTDRHGVEIYEGDVLSDLNRRFIVVWDDAQARFFTRIARGIKEGQRSIGYCSTHCKIIGNIYENSELLNDQA